MRILITKIYPKSEFDMFIMDMQGFEDIVDKYNSRDSNIGAETLSVIGVDRYAISVVCKER